MNNGLTGEISNLNQHVFKLNNEISDLNLKINGLEKDNSELSLKFKELEARINKNSSNSSKPP